MDKKEFNAKYPNVEIAVSPDVWRACAWPLEKTPGKIQPDELEQVQSNIRELFNALPEEYRVILNQRGLKITLGNKNGVPVRPLPSEIETYKAPCHVILSFDSFNQFSYAPGGYRDNDHQRSAELTMQEEMHHALYEPLAKRPEVQQAVAQDLVAPNPKREFALKAFRTYDQKCGRFLE